MKSDDWTMFYSFAFDIRIAYLIEVVSDINQHIIIYAITTGIVLREGDFFPIVCLSVRSRGEGEGPHMATTYDANGQSQVTWGTPDLFKLVYQGTTLTHGHFWTFFPPRPIQTCLL